MHGPFFKRLPPLPPPPNVDVWVVWQPYITPLIKDHWTVQLIVVGEQAIQNCSSVVVVVQYPLPAQTVTKVTTVEGRLNFFKLSFQIFFQYVVIRTRNCWRQQLFVLPSAHLATLKV